jgi:hypothetical protein
LIVLRPMRNILFSLSILGCLCASAWSSGENKLDKIEAFGFSFGSHTQFYDSVQNDTSGGLRKFDFSPTLGVQALIPTPWSINLLPEFNWVLPQEAGSDRIIKNLLMFRLDLGYEVFDFLRLRLGTSFMWQNIHGRGGKETINNGESTSTFYYPDENRSALNNTFDLGVEGLVTENWALRLGTHTYSLFEAERRQISYTLFATYYWSRK